MSNKVEVHFEEAHVASAGFSYDGESSDTFSLGILHELKRGAVAEICQRASELADGRGFTITFGEWQSEVVSEIPKRVAVYRSAVIYLQNSTESAIENPQ